MNGTIISFNYHVVKFIFPFHIVYELLNRQKLYKQQLNQDTEVSSLKNIPLYYPVIVTSSTHPQPLANNVLLSISIVLSLTMSYKWNHIVCNPLHGYITVCVSIYSLKDILAFPVFSYLNKATMSIHVQVFV